MTLNFDELAEKLAKHGIHMAPEQKRETEESRYPELDASIEAGDELDAWKEKCHALEAENAALQSWCKAVEERLKADIDQQKEDMAEIERLRDLLPELLAACEALLQAIENGDFYNDKIAYQAERAIAKARPEARHD